MNKRTIFISGNVASGKNSKRIVGKRLIRSKASIDYIEKTTQQWIDKKDQFLKLIKDIPYPLKIEFFFIRKGRNKFDYNNLIQLPLDMMQWYGWIPDDDMNHVIPIIKGYKVDKTNPGIEISIQKQNANKNS